MAASTGVIAMWGFEPRGTRGTRGIGGIGRASCVVGEVAAEWKTRASRSAGAPLESDFFREPQKPQADCHQSQPLALVQT